MKRNRYILCCFLIITIILGLLTRSSLPMPRFLQTYAGDTLWAVMVYLIIAMLMPSWDIKRIVLISIIVSFGIEFSQVIEWDWLVYLRTTPLRYVLGQGFLVSDLLCYTVGIISVASIEVLWNKRSGNYE